MPGQKTKLWIKTAARQPGRLVRAAGGMISTFYRELRRKVDTSAFRRILYASDLHGSTLCFNKLLDAAIQLEAHAVLIGGDLSGKFLAPIVRIGHELFRAEVGGRFETASGAIELQRMLTQLENSGDYGVVVTEAEALTLSTDHDKYNSVLQSQVTERLRKWTIRAENVLGHAGIRFLVICGNDDAWELDNVIRDAPYVENPELSGKVVLFDRYEVIGESACNRTPYCCPRDMDEETLQARLKKKIEAIDNPRTALFLIHVPPVGLGLDSCAEIDPTTKRPRTIGGMIQMTAGGSSSVRAAIEASQPMLALHGHIHESPGTARLGRTLCCNAGSDYSRGQLRALLIIIDSDEVKAALPVQR